MAATRIASEALAERSLAHVVLSAADPASEAEIIARAGMRGAITVATNMAGRGTDIRLGEGTVELGGLHVILSEPHEAGRIDRQLAGRCGRQGDPGQICPHVALEDDLVGSHIPGWALAAVRLFCSGTNQADEAPRLLRSVVSLIARLAQGRAERLHAGMRADLLKSDEWLGDAIGFVGELE